MQSIAENPSGLDPIYGTLCWCRVNVISDARRGVELTALRKLKPWTMPLIVPGTALSVHCVTKGVQVGYRSCGTEKT